MPLVGMVEGGGEHGGPSPQRDAAVGAHSGRGGCWGRGMRCRGGGFRANILLDGGHPGNFPHEAVEIAPFFFFLSGCCAHGTDAAGDGPWGAQLWVQAYGHRKSPPPHPDATALRERRETPGRAGCETVRTDFTE